jgi:hypothetical protein
MPNSVELVDKGHDFEWIRTGCKCGCEQSLSAYIEYDPDMDIVTANIEMEIGRYESRWQYWDDKCGFWENLWDEICFRYELYRDRIYDAFKILFTGHFKTTGSFLLKGKKEIYEFSDALKSAADKIQNTYDSDEAGTYVQGYRSGLIQAVVELKQKFPDVITNEVAKEIYKKARKDPENL